MLTQHMGQPGSGVPTLLALVSAGEWGHGRVIVPYVGPTPPEGTHRYIFLLYRNPKDMPLGAVGPQVSHPCIGGIASEQMSVDGWSARRAPCSMAAAVG